MASNDISVIKLGLLGCGTVGSGVYKILTDKADDFLRKTGIKIEIKRILVKSLDDMIKVDIDRSLLTTDYKDVTDDPEISIVVEVIGGVTPAKSFILRAIDQGKHIVTANKEVLAKHGREIIDRAKEKNVDVFFEGSVGGGIPIIRPSRQCLIANKIEEIMGIINGTTNYILTKMSKDGLDFAEVLAEAQAKGYAEADPSADVDGFDAAYKLAILSSIAFDTKVELEDIYCEGIRKITKKDIDYAKELGYEIKLLAIAKEVNGQVEARVHPTLISTNHPLSAVNDVFNAIFVKGDSVGEVMFYGRGAGMLPTGSAVVADILDIVRNIRDGVHNRTSIETIEKKNFVPMGDIKVSYYLRMHVLNRPGVLARIAGVLGEFQVSIASVIQKGRGAEVAEIVWVTYEAEEKNLQAALEKVKSLGVIERIDNVIRVEPDAE